MDIVQVIVSLIVIGSAIWVYTDMKKIGMEDETATDTLIGKRLAWRWAVGVFALWIITFPWYLSKRKEFLQNKQFLNKR